MIKSLQVKNFRVFESLNIPQLGRVNLFVGKNNIGKSCLLEALHLYSTSVDLEVLSNLLKKRGEDWEFRGIEEDISIPFAEHPLRHLFHGYTLPQSKDGYISIKQMGEDKNALEVGVLQEFDSDYDTYHLKLQIRQNSGKTKRNLTKLGSNIFKMVSLKKASQNSKTEWVSTDSIRSTYTISRLTDKVFTSFQDRDILFEAMRIIDPKLTEIVMVGRSRQEPIAMYRDYPERKVPLSSMGDGINRLFHIILALINAKDGTLIVDEIENGLYYETQDKIWEIIFELAEKLNIQVFASTHSKDCVNAFSSYLKNHSDKDGLVVRLTNTIRHDDRIVAQVFTPEELAQGEYLALEVR